MKALLILKILLANLSISQTMDLRNVSESSLFEAYNIQPHTSSNGIVIDNFLLTINEGNQIEGTLKIIANPESRYYNLEFQTTNLRFYDPYLYLGTDSRQFERSLNAFGINQDAKKYTASCNYSQTERAVFYMYRQGNIVYLRLRIKPGVIDNAKNN